MSRDGDTELAEAVEGLRTAWSVKNTRADELFTGEDFWRDHQPWLLEKGYQLRARYQPGWKPSWKTSGRWKKDCEDSYTPKARIFVHHRVRLNSSNLAMSSDSTLWTP
jgi:hypothetical protein